MPRVLSFAPARLPLLVALFASTALLLSLGTSTAFAAKPCWERVIDDWIDNGRIDAAYSPACLSAALKNVPEDVRAYSDFEERVKDARQNALRARLLQGSGGTGTTPTTGTPRNQRPQIDRVEEVEPSVPEPDQGPIEDILATGTTDAKSIPLPLIILAAFALLLLAAGAAGFAHRKLQARRVRPRP